MTERPQLSVVDGGKESPTESTTSSPLEARLAAELRAQRELNAGLALDLGAARAAAALAARRHEDLLTQLQLEREARRQVKLQFRESAAEARALADRLRLVEEAGQAAAQNNLHLAARVEAAEAQAAGLALELSKAERLLQTSGETTEHLKGLIRKRDDQMVALRAALGEQAAKQEALRQQIVLVLAESEKAAAKARAVVAASADLKAQVRAFVLELSETLNVKDAPALYEAQASFAPTFAAITAQAAHLYDACAVAQADIAALRAEKGAINVQLAAMTARHADMATKAENRFNRLARDAKELAELRDALSVRHALVSKLEASLKERDQALQAAMQDGRRLQEERDAETDRATHLSKKVAKKDELLIAAAAEARQREAELRQALARAKAASGELASKIEAAGIENARLVRTEQALGAELAELNRLLDERRTTIRQLQQELALIKLGRKKALPGS